MFESYIKNRLRNIHACTHILYHAFTCVFSKLMFDWVSQSTKK